MGPEDSMGLLFLHAISGCNTVSRFHGIGKKTAQVVWGSIFVRLSHASRKVSREGIDKIERSVVFLHVYQRTSSLCYVNETMKEPFSFET